MKTAWFQNAKVYLFYKTYSTGSVLSTWGFDQGMCIRLECLSGIRTGRGPARMASGRGKIENQLSIENHTEKELPRTESTRLGKTLQDISEGFWESSRPQSCRGVMGQEGIHG
jgi:hypothetical protein